MWGMSKGLCLWQSISQTPTGGTSEESNAGQERAKTVTKAAWGSNAGSA